MVEAAIFFPIVIFAIMATLYLLINMYSQTSSQAFMHERLRQQVADRAEIVSVKIDDEFVRDKYRRSAESVGIGITEGQVFGRDYLEARADNRYFGGLLAKSGGYKYEFYGRNYVIDEGEIVRRSLIAYI
jgi:hypothetical protein